MSPEEKARLAIDQKLIQSGWVIQNMKNLNLTSAMGITVRKFPTSTGEVDYAIFIDRTPVGVVEAKRTESGEKITTVEDQSARYAGSKFKWIKGDTAITAAYCLLKFGKMNRILFLVDTRSLGEQAEREFLAYIPNDDPRPFSDIYGAYRLKSSRMPANTQIYISTIQRMYSILKGEDLDESVEETPFSEYVIADSKAPKDVVYNEKYPPEFFVYIIVDEFHRSIYNVWSQAPEYFDAFIIGLTATPTTSSKLSGRSLARAMSSARRSPIPRKTRKMPLLASATASIPELPSPWT